MRLHKLFEGYRILPSIDRNRYQERDGLEGPFRAANGAVYYYDPREGKAYDPDSDMYISHDDFEQMDKDRDFNESTEGTAGPDYTDPEGKFVVVSDGYRFYSIGINQYAEQLPLTNRGFKSVEDAIEDAEELLGDSELAEGYGDEIFIEVTVSTARQANEALADARIPHETDGSNRFIFANTDDAEAALDQFDHWNIEIAEVNLDTDAPTWDRSSGEDEDLNEEAADFVRDMMRVHGWSRAKAEAEAKKRFPEEYGIDPNAGRNIEIRIDGRPWKVVSNLGHARAIIKTLTAKGKDAKGFYTDKPVSPDKRK